MAQRWRGAQRRRHCKSAGRGSQAVLLSQSACLPRSPPWCRTSTARTAAGEVARRSLRWDLAEEAIHLELHGANALTPRRFSQVRSVVDPSWTCPNPLAGSSPPSSSSGVPVSGPQGRSSPPPIFRHVGHSVHFRHVARSSAPAHSRCLTARRGPGDRSVRRDAGPSRRRPPLRGANWVPRLTGHVSEERSSSVPGEGSPPIVARWRGDR